MARLILCLVIGLSASLSFAETVLHYQGRTMGTTYNVKFTEYRPIDFQVKIDELLKEVNRQMSTYITSSEISAFNQGELERVYPIAKEFAYVVALSQEIFRRTEGAFDPTVGRLVNLWGFGPEGQPEKVPSDVDLERIRSQIGLDKIVLSEQGLSKTSDQVYLDLSAIAKGYGVDLLAEYLEKQGIGHYMVEIGGEVRTKGMKSPGHPWKIGIEMPSSGNRQLLKVVKLENKSLATSGDYRNYFETNGQRFSHLIDPRSGKPITHKLASVSVLADSCAEADSLATAFMVLGPDEAMRIAKRDQVGALMIVRDGNGFKTMVSPGFEPYLLN
nr:FAD:protein FMN transferase [Pseudobacteriovorax antillogorgiicola]